MNQKLGTYNALAMPSIRALLACSGGKGRAEAIAVTTPTMADTGSSPRALPIELAQPDGAGGAHLAPELPGDDEARDEEEYVRADEPTTHTRHGNVKAENGQQREAAQALDIRTKSDLRRALTLHSFNRANGVGLAYDHPTVCTWTRILVVGEESKQAVLAQ